MNKKSKTVLIASILFYESAVTTLDLSSFDTSNVTDMTGMFPIVLPQLDMQEIRQMLIDLMILVLIFLIL